MATRPSFHATSPQTPRLRLVFGQKPTAVLPGLEGIHRQFDSLRQNAQGIPQANKLLSQIDALQTSVKDHFQLQEDRFQKLSTASETDILTGLKNRAFFDRVLQIKFKNAQDNNTPLSVIMVDLDRFKAINDQFGHDAGDEALKHFSAALQRGVGEHGFACRLGGDEFAVLLPGGDLSAAQQTAERIRNNVSKATFKFSHNGVKHDIHLASSQGIASLHHSAGNAARNAPTNAAADSSTEDFVSVGLYAPSQAIIKPKLTGMQRLNPSRQLKLHRLWKDSVQQPQPPVQTAHDLVKLADHAMYCTKNLSKILDTRHPVMGRQVTTSSTD